MPGRRSHATGVSMRTTSVEEDRAAVHLTIRMRDGTMEEDWAFHHGEDGWQLSHVPQVLMGAWDHDGHPWVEGDRTPAPMPADDHRHHGFTAASTPTTPDGGSMHRDADPDEPAPQDPPAMTGDGSGGADDGTRHRGEGEPSMGHERTGPTSMDHQGGDGGRG